MNLKPETVKPETGLLSALAGCILTALLVGEGSPVVYAVVEEARDPFVDAFEAQA